MSSYFSWRGLWLVGFLCMSSILAPSVGAQFELPPAPPQSSPEPIDAQQARNMVYKFESSLSAEPDARIVAARKFFAQAKDPLVKIEAVGMLDSRYVYSLPKDIFGDLLGPLLQDPVLAVRVRAARAVASNGLGKDHSTALIALIKEEDIEAKLAALTAMGRSGDAKLEAIVVEHLRHPNGRVRGQAVFLLSGSPRHLRELAKLLEDPDGQVRHNVLYSGVELSPERLAKLAEDPSQQVREGVVDALKGRDRPENRRTMAGLLKDSAPYVRGKAALALGELKSKEHIKDVAALIDDEDVYVRRVTTQALGHFADPNYRTALEQLLQDPDAQIPEYAVQSLAAIGDKASGKAIVPLLKHPNAGVRREAVAALSKIGAKEYVKDILPLLDIKDEGDFRGAAVVAAAVRAVGRLGDASHLPKLRVMQCHPDQFVQDAARGAVAEIERGVPKAEGNRD